MKRIITDKAMELGFDLVGFGPAGPAPHARAFSQWLNTGHQADMQWMERNTERRCNPAEVVPGARTVITLGLSYFVADPPPEYWDDPLRGRIARYAWGPDYHDVLTPMLKELTSFIHDEAKEDVQCRYYVDTGPVLERETAWQAGMGFIGKNSLLIRPGWSSYLFLAEIITSLELEPDPPALDAGARWAAPAAPEREGTCGSCTRCLDACPTAAFTAPYVLDSRRCISWLTIENKGAIDEALRPLMGNWIYGCDICQEVCPWVKQYAKSGNQTFLSFDPDRCTPRLEDLMRMDEEAFRVRFRKTPMKRTKRRGLLRNAAVALGNSGQEEALAGLQIGRADGDELVRAHAEWGWQRVKNADPEAGGRAGFSSPGESEFGTPT